MQNHIFNTQLESLKALGWVLVSTERQLTNGTFVFQKGREQLAAYSNGWLRRKNLDQPSPYMGPRWYQVHKTSHGSSLGALNAMIGYIVKFGK